ncbi:thiamine phosphate synthase [Alsobacter sp. SYSU M60028]|uniref:Thiamine phosphate synthase n=1 Tax=Alsobacter ponti TaxID=2962936 RepID=A0ABT1LFE0_9HYPH|nr:thiamine phosphate synthase [Alsobacter ponti]MCP8940159.1 thiamine phosphate synthase [Alsobacter ponti]
MTDRARLVLMTPPVPASATPESWPGPLAAELRAALAAGRVDAVILRLPAFDERTLTKAVKPLVAIVQEAGAAALLEDAAPIVARAGADGVHLTGPEALGPTLQALKPHERIVGVGGLRARHDAMEAAETGCDYVLFGEPREDGSAPPLSGVLERVGWWAELFEVPCVGYVAETGQAGDMAATGCEFVALGPDCFARPGSAAEAVRGALAAIAQAPEARR